MRKRESIIAREIEREYRIKKAFEKKKRQKCIIDQEKKCDICAYQSICEDKEEIICQK